MANKSFVIQYLIKAREQYVAVANKVRISSEKMRKSIERTKKAFVDASAKMRRAGAIMSAAITVPVALIARSLKNAARDAEETRSKFATVFSDLGVNAEKTADTFAKNFGLAGTSARQLLGDTGDILVGFGFTEKATLDLSLKVNRLAVDLASFSNFAGGAEGASKALTKALLGEAESVKALGIVIRQDTPEYKGLVNWIQRTQKVSLVQAKALAALRIATKQSSKAIGDHARTLEELANQERLTSERIKDLKESFGRVLLPVAQKITRAIRSVAVWMANLSPSTKKTILIIAALVAVLGPLLLLLGSIALVFPALIAGFTAFGAIAAGALGPIAIIAALVALAATFIIRNWVKVSAFFDGFSVGINATLGPTIAKLVDDFTKAAGIIAKLFSTDSEAAQNLLAFGSIGELIGTIIGGTLDLIIRGLSGIGAIIGQVIGAITTLDFGQFDIEAIKAEFLGTQAKPILAQSRVDVGVNVGLDQGLTQTSPVSIAGAGGRRADVGIFTP